MYLECGASSLWNHIIIQQTQCLGQAAIGNEGHDDNKLDYKRNVQEIFDAKKDKVLADTECSLSRVGSFSGSLSNPSPNWGTDLRSRQFIKGEKVAVEFIVKPSGFSSYSSAESDYWSHSRTAIKTKTVMGNVNIRPSVGNKIVAYYEIEGARYNAAEKTEGFRFILKNNTTQRPSNCELVLSSVELTVKNIDFHVQATTDGTGVKGFPPKPARKS